MTIFLYSRHITLYLVLRITMASPAWWRRAIPALLAGRRHNWWRMYGARYLVCAIWVLYTPIM